MDAQFRALVAAYLTAAVNCLRLGVEVAACALPTAAFYIPATSWVRYHMVGLRSFGHFDLLNNGDTVYIATPNKLNVCCLLVKALKCA
jgi:hypothetical protein